MQIDVYQDLVCPWCRIGKHNLDQALKEWTGAPVTVRYLPFFLDDSVPAENPPSFQDYMKKRMGTTDLAPMFERVSQVGERAGLTFNFDRIPVATNTLLAHRLVALTPPVLQSVMLDALHQAYFADGRDISNLATLVEIAGSVGLDKKAISARLSSDEAAAEVRAAAHEARHLGVSGVPFFVFDNAISASGAQPPAVLLQGMRQAEELALAAR